MTKIKERSIWKRTSSPAAIGAAYGMRGMIASMGTFGIGSAVSSLKMKVAKAYKVVKDSYGRRKIQRKQTLYKGGRWNGNDTKRRNFWGKVRSTHSYNPDPRNRHFWHAYARNNTPLVEQG